MTKGLEVEMPKSEEARELWPGQLVPEEQLPIIDAPRTRSIPFDQMINFHDWLLVRNPDTGRVLAAASVGHMTTDYDNPYDIDRLEEDVRDGIAARGLIVNGYEVVIWDLPGDDDKRLRGSVADVDIEDLTGGESSGDYMIYDNEEED